tara:strand:- start:298 stop:525 length:228 start_codon:yes stop_codon:yes gene_type:complete
MISSKLIEAINEVLPDLNLEDLNLNDSFANNSIDSLDTMSIFLELKEKDIDLSDEEIDTHCNTIQSTSDYIESKL